MFTFRNVLAVASFLFGSTFLWMMPLFIGPTATGAVWTVAQVIGLLAILGFTAGAWGIFKVTSWWEPVTLVSCVVGIAAVVPYAIAAPSLAVGGDPLSVAINVGLHGLGSAAVILALRVRPVEQWIAARL